MVALASYFATLGVKTDDKGLKAVDDYLKRIENKLKRGTSNNGLLLNVGINERFFRKSVAQAIEKSVFQVKISPVLNKSSLAALRQQIQSMFLNTPVSMNVRVSGAGRGGGSGGGGGRPSARSPNTPSVAERLAGKPDKNSLSAANRRWFDSLMNEGILGGPRETPSGVLFQGLSQGLGRLGTSTMAGRGMGILGNALGGARGGALGVLAAGAGTLAVQGVGTIWKSLGTMITAPFQLVSGAVRTVTDSFYRLAMTMAPVIAAFYGVNKKVQDVSSRGIAMNATSTRLGTSGDAERLWLYRMAQTEGMRYSDMQMPYASFLNAYAPRGGVDAAQDMFQAFSQYGRVFGATRESSGRAFYALSQIASKDQFMSEEVNQQLAEAQGYSGMKGLIAQAYQMSLGKSEEEAKKNTKAMVELTDAMKKGVVKPDKIFPILVELMKDASKVGIEEARKSPGAMEDRFWNSLERGWERFSSGGGNRGLARFWEDMQNSIGAWFEENGAWLGKQFDILMKGFKVFRMGITDFAKYMWTGENNSLTAWLTQEQGIDVVAIRNFFKGMWEAIKDITSNIASALGILDAEGNFDFAQFSARIKSFTTHVGAAFSEIGEMLRYFSTALAQFGQVADKGFFGLMEAWVNPWSETRSNLTSGYANIGRGLASLGSATSSAFQGVAAPVTPIDLSGGAQGLTLPNRLTGQMVGDGSSGMSPRQAALLVAANSVGGNAAYGIGGRQAMDINVNLKVEGDPESIKTFAAEAVAYGIAREVPAAVGMTFRGIVVDAPK